ncbi:MAG: terminase small subunit [Nitrososphaerales archaeon]
MSHKLTQKQEAFVLTYIETGNASKAYRQTYKATKMKENTINRCAFELLQNPKIATRIDALRTQSAKLVVLDKAMVLNNLIKITTESMEKNPETGAMQKPDTAVRALELLGKHLKLWAPETQIGIQINEGREPFEKILERAITITGGGPDHEEKTLRDIGELFQRYRRGDPLPDPIVIGGLYDDIFADALPE